MFIEGDTISGLGKIDSNHCGLPWVCGFNGMFYGVLNVRLFTPYRSAQCPSCKCSQWVDSVMVDALSGKILCPDEINERLNNVKFDYEQKTSQEWKLKNRERIKKNFTYIPIKETLWEAIQRRVFKRYFKCMG